MSGNGSGRRKLASFIDGFIDATASIGAPHIFQKWTAISLISAALEEKVWIQTSRPVFPNQYIFLVAHPGVGKTRIINEGKLLYNKLEKPHQAPTSAYFASVVDALYESKRSILRQPEGEVSYNSMYITADELGAFMFKYDREMIAGLTAFYDTTPYQHRRRTNDINITIPSPQLNILSGSTPSNLLEFVPDIAWSQGFTSRIIMVFSDERVLVDDFSDSAPIITTDLVHDLKVISQLYGQFHVTESFKEAVRTWLALGEPPIPTHPRLTHYVTRRKVHIYKLSMVASINRDNSLSLIEADFIQAAKWLFEAEVFIEDIFKAGTGNPDAAAFNDIQHYIMINDMGSGVSEQRIVQFAQQRVPLQSILRVIDIMERSGQIHCKRVDARTKVRYYSANSSMKTTGPTGSLLKSVGQ